VVVNVIVNVYADADVIVIVVVVVVVAGIDPTKGELNSHITTYAAASY
jgi:hypothetical protein